MKPAIKTHRTSFCHYRHTAAGRQNIYDHSKITESRAQHARYQGYAVASKQQAAFTLMELLICLAIACILLLGASSADFDFQIRNRLETITDNLLENINFARSRALINEKGVIMTPINGDWNKGVWICDGTTLRDCQTRSSLIREQAWHNTNTRIHWHGFQSDEALFFAPDIRRMTSNGYFILESGRKIRKITINRLGLARVINHGDE